MNTPSTPQQHAAIVLAAQNRARFIRWIAERLLGSDDIRIRREASRILLQLLGDV
jgi:hypothetical protein